MTTETLWAECLKIMREEVGSRIVETWFASIKCIRWDSINKTVYLQAPNQFVQDWVLKHYAELCKKNCARLLSEPTINVVFLHNVDNTSKKTEEKADNKQQSLSALYTPATSIKAEEKTSIQANALIAAPSMSKLIQSRERLKGYSTGQLNEHYRFSNFIAGPSNNLAFSAAQVVAEHAGYLYNPLFIYGDSGLGKTHLLHAIGHAIREKNKKTHVFYQTADHFVRDFISAIRSNKVYQFEMRYKDIDVLLVDDVQFISNKEQTQEAFFHIFNMLHQKQKQIVVTSDSMPRDIIGLAQRMRSRLEGGLLADIHSPVLETRIAIVQQKGEAFGHQIPDDVAHFIAVCGSGNIRELEGMLLRVIASAALSQEQLSCALVKRILFNNEASHSIESISLSHIAEIVAKHYGYSVADLCSQSRNKDLSHARHVACYCMKKLTTFSFREMSKFLQRKDHSTMLYAVDKITQRIATEAEFAQEMHALEQKCVSMQHS